jgi:ATP-binding cassette subfamily B protein
VISAGPRFVIEAIGIVAIAVIAYALSTRPGGVIAAIPIMGALAVGAQRMLPLLQQAYSSWALMMGNRDSLGDALKLLELPEPDEKAAADEVKRIPFDSEIRLENVSFHYQPEGPAVLEQLDLRIPKGARIGFIGETGSGKSTLIDVLIGLLSPSGGRMTVDGRTIDLSNHKAWQKHIAHVPQTIFLSDASIADNIAIGARGEIDRERVQLAARQARIADTIEAWPDGYKTSVGERGVKLSGGQRQRIGIARALYKQADVIIFDEATSALDSDTERAVMQAIDELGSELTILIVAHRLTTLKGCSQIYELQAGRLKPVGTYADLVEEAAV